jgi:FkbM family methyltransferase
MAYLFGNHRVKVHPLTRQVRGSFVTANNQTRAWDAGLLKEFYQRTVALEKPVVVDVGASTGSYSLLTTLHPGMRVFAFEPNPSVYEILLENIKRNGVEDRVTPYCIALYDEDGKARLSVPKDIGASGLATLSQSPLRFKAKRVVEIETRRLDDIEVPPPDFIKIDTEGAEVLVLRGGKQTIREHHPVMLLEHHNVNTRQMGFTLGDVTSLLEKWGATWEKAGREDIWAYWL